MDALATVCDAIAQTNSRLKKVRVAAEYLRGLEEADFLLAVRFLIASPIADTERQLSVGHAKLREAVMRVLPWDEETVRLCFREVGDAGEAIGLLLEGHTRGDALSLAEAALWFQRLHAARTANAKVDLLEKIFLTYKPRTLLYFIKVITGDLRIGFQARQVEEAIAAAVDVPHAMVREAANRSGDLARVAAAARRGELEQVGASLFHPMDFMLAKPLEQEGAIENPAQWVVEDKYDGIRCQLHVGNGRIAIYTRGLDEVSGSYPEIVAALRAVPHSLIVDGELLAWRDDRALNFTLLQQRLARKTVSAQLLDEVPVAFVAYDLLYANGTLWLDRAVEDRRAELQRVWGGLGMPLLLAPQEGLGDLDAQFEAARTRGNEGLILKRAGSVYEAGRRSGAWVKVKRALATLDVVVTAAEQGTGRRAVWLSDYTFAVRDGERYANVGKAYSGLTDDEVRELTRVFRGLTTERFGRVSLVQPSVVLEVAFDGIQKSPRHKSGFALRFPRIVRWRRDKAPEQADDIARVKELYEASLQ
ncbi:MAG: ATP-dependent DNA ligase [Bryobacterales bacterium]|nr:ATP-dependent DNA ligase [Bryobacterales bacterium]